MKTYNNMAIFDEVPEAQAARAYAAAHPPSLESQFLGRFLEEIDEDRALEIVKDVLQESEEMAMVEFYALRRHYQLWREEHCAGLPGRLFCGRKKSKYAEVCDDCEDAREEEPSFADKMKEMEAMV